MLINHKSRFFPIVSIVLVGSLVSSAQFRQHENANPATVNLKLPPASNFYKSKFRIDQRGVVLGYFNSLEFSYSPFRKLPGELINQTQKFGQIPSTTLMSPLMQKDQLNIWLPGYQQVPIKQQITQGLFGLASGLYTYSRVKD